MRMSSLTKTQFAKFSECFRDLECLIDVSLINLLRFGKITCNEIHTYLNRIDSIDSLIMTTESFSLSFSFLPSTKKILTFPSLIHATQNQYFKYSFLKLRKELN